MKLWRVTCDVELYVLADTEEQACEIAAGSEPEDEVRDQTREAGTWFAARVPFLFKQWGAWAPRGPRPDYEPVDDVPRVRLTICGCNSQSDVTAHGVPGGRTRHDCDDDADAWMQRVGKAAAGRLLDGVLHDEYPEVTR